MKAIVLVKIFCVLFGISFLCTYWVGEVIALPMILLLLWGFFPMGMIAFGLLIVLLFNILKKDWQIKKLKIVFWISIIFPAVLIYFNSEVTASIRRSIISYWSFMIFEVISVIYFSTIIFAYIQLRRELNNTSLTTDYRLPTTHV